MDRVARAIEIRISASEGGSSSRIFASVFAASWGSPASPGSYTGRVRVVRGEADFGAVLPGEVLVCPTASPSWTILFAIAGALVTDGGGQLAHAAIVAREHQDVDSMQ